MVFIALHIKTVIRPWVEQYAGYNKFFFTFCLDPFLHLVYLWRMNDIHDLDVVLYK